MMHCAHKGNGTPANTQIKADFQTWYPENVAAWDCEDNGGQVLLIQNYFHKNQAGRLCKGRKSRIF